jgi:hypothetical protein
VTRDRESFHQRVQTLRDSWSERRQVRSLASAHDFDSQLQLLSLLYDWTLDAIQDIRDVYSDELTIEISPRPTAQDRNPGFSLVIGGAYSLRLILGERARGGTDHWFISVTLSSSGTGGGSIAAGPQRRTGQWTRSQLEEVILSALGSYERTTANDPGD